MFNVFLVFAVESQFALFQSG